MIKKEIINGKVFLEQRTYYVYQDEVAQRASQPSAITSDEKEFKLLKKVEKKRIKITSDKKILEVYMQGFTDELDGRPKPNFLDPALVKAYDTGRIDALVGDDMPNHDYRSDEEILKTIKNKS